MAGKTVAYVQEELDNYGGHLPVLVEDADGDRYEVEEVGSATIDGGYAAAVLYVGPKRS